MEEESSFHARPRATVIVPIRNSEPYVGRAIRSLVDQWRPDLELLIIDDGSSDDSYAAAKEAIRSATGVSAIFLRNERSLGMGMVPQMLRHARGSVIIQADSDDIALPGRFDELLARFEHDPRCRLVTSNAVLLSPAGSSIGLQDTGSPDHVFDDAMEAASSVGSPRWLGATSAFHRSLFDDFPPIDPRLCPYGMDLLLPFRACVVGTHHYLSAPLVGWRQHALNTHRLAGAHGLTRGAAERHGAFELMILAQKLRDLEALSERVGDQFGPLAAACQTTFLDHFTSWTRIRNSPDDVERDAHADAPICHEPPSLVLRRGERRFFGERDSLGVAAEAWSGVFKSETFWNWTSRSALVTLLPEGGTSKIFMGMSKTSMVERLDVSISINLGARHAFDVTDEHRTFEADIDGDGCRRIDLVIHVPGAVSPSSLGVSSDARILGVQLLWIELA